MLPSWPPDIPSAVQSASDFSEAAATAVQRVAICGSLELKQSIWQWTQHASGEHNASHAAGRDICVTGDISFARKPSTVCV